MLEALISSKSHKVLGFIDDNRNLWGRTINDVQIYSSNIIEKEIESWKNLLSNSEKMVNELSQRKNKFNSQLDKLDNQPKLQAEKKGQISENLRISENEKNNNQIKVSNLEERLTESKNKLNEIKESSIGVREKRASANATIVGLNKRKSDLIERIETELNIMEKNLLEFSNLEKEEEFPDTVTQEELLDKKKRDRDNLGSVNLIGQTKS